MQLLKLNFNDYSFILDISTSFHVFSSFIPGSKTGKTIVCVATELLRSHRSAEEISVERFILVFSTIAALVVNM